MTETRPRPLETPAATGDARLDALATLLAVIDRLRAPDGCPWDLEQTLGSLAPSAIEEAHELVEAIETQQDDATCAGEAGDLLMVVLLLCRIAADEGRFDAEATARSVTEKLVRRHPHVFGSEAADDASHVLVNWERIKREERREKGEDTSALAGVPKTLPALQRADRIGAKARSVGFRWETTEAALRKLEEEVAELRQAIESHGPEDSRVADELGDVFLAGAQLAGYLKLDPEGAARESIRRFEGRFRRVEAELGAGFGEATLEELMGAWERAKRESARLSDPGENSLDR